MGEGAGALLLERSVTVEARGARPLATVAGGNCRIGSAAGAAADVDASAACLAAARFGSVSRCPPRGTSRSLGGAQVADPGSAEEPRPRGPGSLIPAAAGHPFVGVAWLRDNGWSEEVCRAILSHADYSNVSRETAMEKTLYAVDELSSFVVAVALVRPTKSIHDVDVRAVKKKMKDKAFARAVNREDIVRGAEELGMPLDDVIAEVIAALKSDAERLGLAGITS